MDSLAILWCLMILPNGIIDASAQEHTIMIKYDDIANKTVVYKLVHYSLVDDPDKILIAVINTNEHPSVEEYLSTTYRDVIIKNIQTVTIQEQH